MSGSDVSVFREDRRKVVVDVAGRQIGFAFNPESGFVLVPEGVYKSEPEVVEGLRVCFVIGVSKRCEFAVCFLGFVVVVVCMGYYVYRHEGGLKVEKEGPFDSEVAAQERADEWNREIDIACGGF